MERSIGIGIIRKITSKAKFAGNKPAAAAGLLDAHTHMLPQMDDGSSSVEESLQMIRASVSQGVSAIAMTPHFYPRRESPQRFLKRREQAAQALIRAAEQEPGMPGILLGAEAEYFEGISRSDMIEALCIGRSRVLLIEMPFCNWNQRMLNELLLLRNSRGIIPLLAHVERYLSDQRAETVQELCDAGILIQANASFFLRRTSAHRAMRMLKNGQIHLLGSDSHNMRSRPPNLGLAVERICSKCGERELERLKDMQQLVLGGCE